METTTEIIDYAFKDDDLLRKRVHNAISDAPEQESLLRDIAKWVAYRWRAPLEDLEMKNKEITEQPAKKRKLDETSSAPNGSQPDQPRSIILEARDISFILPQRKKLHLSIVQYGSDFAASTTTFALCGRNPATSQVEFEHPTTAFAYSMRVSVPEKAQKQYNFCLLPSQTQSTSGVPSLMDGVIWTVNYGPLKSCQIFSEGLKAHVGSDSVLEDALHAILQRSGNKLVYPKDEEFVSALVESHRKNDKAYHVKAFRGGKDGYLFFLENGIFFGFKKPLAFFPFENIESVSYTAVLKRTFNLVIVARASNTAEEQEIEFSMLDQADFAGIDMYIKKHQLQDASMAEARRAKQFKVNGTKGGAGEGQDDDGQTELQRAEQELEDEEDELEEDYDPGSDGESEGSGSSDDDEEYELNRSDKKKDLVKEELGSEAEDVEITDEEENDDEVEEEDTNDESQAWEQDSKRQPAPPPQPPPARKSNTQQATVDVKPSTALAARPLQGIPDIDDEDQL